MKKDYAIYSILLLVVSLLILSSCTLLKSASQKAAEQKAKECYKTLLDQHQNFSYRNYHSIEVQKTAPLLANEWRIIVEAEYETEDMEDQCGQVVVYDDTKECKEKIQDVKC